MTQPDPISGASTAGDILALLRSGAAASRSEIEHVTGLSRATVMQRLNTLLAHGLARIDGVAPSSGGRPAQRYALAAGHAHVLGVDIGEEVTRIALFDLAATLLDERTVAIDVAGEPHRFLSEIAGNAGALLARRPVDVPVFGIGLSLPAPVDYAAARVTGPSVMPGWEHVDIRRHLGAALAMPVVLDNDVNLMALAEHRLHWRDSRAFLFIKAGTGIGCGIVTEGALFRGSRGMSGDIGHIQLPRSAPKLCRCGKTGCIEAHAAGWAIARDLRAVGFPAANARDVMALHDSGNSHCLNLIQESARLLGEVAADLVSILNPETIVLGGHLSQAGEQMLSGIREMIYGRCLPLATRDLAIHTARGDERLGVVGAAMLAIDRALAPHRVDARLAAAVQEA